MTFRDAGWITIVGFIIAAVLWGGHLLGFWDISI